MGYKIGILINGDTAPGHLGNIDLAVKCLEAQGFETCVASPRVPGVKADHFATASWDGLRLLLEGLRAEGKLTADDELVIYATGHGELARGKEEPVISGVGRELVELLDAIPFRQRTVIMDPCFGGNWALRFLDNPRTLFISAGSEGENVACKEFTPRFWSLDATDFNHDGEVNWQERYNFALAGGMVASTPILLQSPGYKSLGRRPFTPSAIDVADPIALKHELSRLAAGQLAVVAFSQPSCGAPDDFRVAFDEQALRDGGEYIFIRTESKEAAKDFGATQFPSVAIVDYHGRYFFAIDPFQAVDEVIYFNLLFHERLGTVRQNVWSLDTNKVKDSTAYRYYRRICEKMREKEKIAEMRLLRTVLEGAHIEAPVGELACAGALIHSLRKDKGAFDKEFKLWIPLLQRMIEHPDSVVRMLCCWIIVDISPRMKVGDFSLLSLQVLNLFKDRDRSTRKAAVGAYLALAPHISSEELLQGKMACRDMSDPKESSDCNSKFLNMFKR